LLISQGGCATVPGVDDTATFAEAVEAMSCLGFADELGEVWRLLAALLELGNLEFKEDGDNNSFGGCCPTDDAQLRRCAEQLGCEANPNPDPDPNPNPNPNQRGRAAGLRG